MPDFNKIIFRSGFCLDTVPALRLYLRGLDSPLARPLLLASRLKFTPDVLQAIRRSSLDPAQKSRLFSGAMNLFRSGPTFKTTGAGRTPLTDRAILARAAAGDDIVETGVSDGVSALGLLAARQGAGVILSDRQDAFRYRDFGPFRVFYDKEDGARSIKFLFLYFCTGAGGPAPAAAESVSLLNPEVEARFPRAALLPFDIFSGELRRPAAFIKCANVLNLAYFSPADARRAAANLLRSLREGGRLFISQSNPAYRDGEACLVLRREGASFVLEEEFNGHELLSHVRAPLFAGLVRGPEAGA